MLRDITIGQHFPGHSVLHRCDPRLKLVGVIAYIIVLFVASNPLGLALSLAMLAALYKVAQIPYKLILKSLKPILPIILFTALLNIFYQVGEGAPLVQFWIFRNLPRRHCLCRADRGAGGRADRRHQPFDLHDQPDCADRCD